MSFSEGGYTLYRPTLYKHGNGNCNIFCKLPISWKGFDLFRNLMTFTDATRGIIYSLHYQGMLYWKLYYGRSFQARRPLTWCLLPRLTMYTHCGVPFYRKTDVLCELCVIWAIITSPAFSQGPRVVSDKSPRLAVNSEDMWKSDNRLGGEWGLALGNKMIRFINFNGPGSQ